MNKIVIVENLKEETRLDKFLSDLTSVSRANIQRIISDGKVIINDKIITKESFKVKNGDSINIEFEPPKESHIEAEEIPLDIVFEDDDLLVVNKPKGMVVHPAVGNKSGTLVNAVLAHCYNEKTGTTSLSGIGGEIRPGIVHRIDKDTSGLVIIAKNDKAHLDLSNQIKNHKVKKTYLALVRGEIAEDEATIDMPIARDPRDRQKMAVIKDGKNAITHFKVIKRFATQKGSYTLLEVQIETGRTHQIRVHMSKIGHPVIGDEVYSNGKNEFGIKGQALHAWKLEFKHPITEKQISLESPLPDWYNKIG